jgi:hypothetical protein
MTLCGDFTPFDGHIQLTLQLSTHMYAGHTGPSRGSWPYHHEIDATRVAGHAKVVGASGKDIHLGH